MAQRVKFRRGLTISQRQKIRAAVLDREYRKAEDRARSCRRSVECVAAMANMAAHPATAREQHAACKAEEHGGPGCLCECHDTRTGTVSAGVINAGMSLVAEIVVSSPRGPLTDGLPAL